MKKYLAAAVVAVMVFAFAAFAASLNVQGGVLQAGADEDLECAETAEVTNWGYESGDQTVHFVRVTGIDGCEGERIIISLHDEDGTQVPGPGAANRVSEIIPSNDPGDRVMFSLPNPVPAADVYEVRIAIHSSASS